MELINGDILICTSNRKIPRLIKWATKSKWTHSAIYLEFEGFPGVIEAQPDGINWKPFKNWQEKYGYEFIVYRKRMTERERTALPALALSKAGKTAYDFESFILRQPIKLLTGKWRTRSKEDKKMICSEFVGWVFKMKDWHKMTPDEQKEYMDGNIAYNLVN